VKIVLESRKRIQKVIETYFVCVFSVEEFKTFLNCQHSSKSIRTKPQLSLGLLKISLPNLKREINSWLNLRCCRTPSCKRIDRISRTDLLCPNIYFGCYLEGSPLQGLKLWGPGTFYVPPGGMPAGPVPHPGQPTAVAQNGTVYYHHTPVRAVSNCQMLFIFWQPFYKTSFLTCFQTLVRKLNLTRMHRSNGQKFNFKSSFKVISYKLLFWSHFVGLRPDILF
jgi:hypothetical protein